MGDLAITDHPANLLDQIVFERNILVARQLGTVTVSNPGDGLADAEAKRAQDRSKSLPSVNCLPSFRVTKLSGKVIGSRSRAGPRLSCYPADRDAPRTDICASIASARAKPRTVFSGSSDFSKRMEASVRSLWRAEVNRTLVAWKLALSKTMRVVVSEIALSAPPMTPASAMGPASSAITRSVSVKIVGLAVQRAQSFPGACQPNVDRVARSACPRSNACIGCGSSAKHVVRDVDDVVDRVQANAFQPRLQPQRGGLDAHVFDQQSAIARTKRVILDPTCTGRLTLRQERQLHRIAQRACSDRRHFARHSDSAPTDPAGASGSCCRFR